MVRILAAGDSYGLQGNSEGKHGLKKFDSSYKNKIDGTYDKRFPFTSIPNEAFKAIRDREDGHQSHQVILECSGF